MDNNYIGELIFSPADLSAFHKILIINTFLLFIRLKYPDHFYKPLHIIFVQGGNGNAMCFAGGTVNKIYFIIREGRNNTHMTYIANSTVGASK